MLFHSGRRLPVGNGLAATVAAARYLCCVYVTALCRTVYHRRDVQRVDAGVVRTRGQFLVDEIQAQI